MGILYKKSLAVINLVNSDVIRLRMINKIERGLDYVKEFLEGLNIEKCINLDRLVVDFDGVLDVVMIICDFYR